MKKTLYIILFSLAAATSLTACTEEEVTPTIELNGGGNASDPK